MLTNKGIINETRLIITVNEAIISFENQKHVLYMNEFSALILKTPYFHSNCAILYIRILHHLHHHKCPVQI